MIPTSRISGTVVDSNGRPLGGRFLTIMQRTGGMISMNRGTMVHPDGNGMPSGSMLKAVRQGAADVTDTC